MLSDDDMELDSEAQREIDLILDRQNKRARGEGKDDKECRTPPHARRAAPAARVGSDARAVGREEQREIDDEPIVALPARHSIHHTPSIPPHIDAYHPPFPTMMPHQIQPGMMLNLHLNNAMPPFPRLPPNARGDLRP